MPETMSRNEILERVCVLAAAQAGMTRAEVTAECHLFNDLNFDSLDKVDFVMAVEDEFDVTVPDEQADQVKTIGQAVDLLVPMVQSAPAGTC
ncbi:MAG: acyl carrier protein [Phycisphaerae bacterium]|nr:acyl carrier protein [Phycisphaerae bacterium]